MCMWAGVRVRAVVSEGRQGGVLFIHIQCMYIVYNIHILYTIYNIPVGQQGGVRVCACVHLCARAFA